MLDAGHAARREGLRSLMEQHDLGVIILRQPSSFAWYTGGADNRVDHSSPVGVADITVTEDVEAVFTSTIEAERFRKEETPDLPVAIYPWYEDREKYLNGLLRGPSFGCDMPALGGIDLSSEIKDLRSVLDAETIERYRGVGRDTMAAIDEVAASLLSGVTEWEVATRLVEACHRRGLFSPVVLAAGDRRIEGYRHPIPKDNPCHQRVMMVVCAERGGLYANLTRFVHFEEPDAELRARLDACDMILHAMRDEATKPGRTLAEVFDDCLRLYERAGYGGEWRLHHQGGTTGYASRETVATPETTQPIRVGNAFSWNPSITGAKAEETFVLTESGPEVIAGR